MFDNHPVKKLPLEHQILYLMGLALVMSADGCLHKKQQDYICLLVKSFGLDHSLVDDVIAFANSPDKETALGFFHAFRRNPLAQLFLFDAYMLSMKNDTFHEQEKAVIDKMAEQLEVLVGTQKDIFELFCFIKNKDWRECSPYFNGHLLNSDHFEHLLDYYEINLENLLKDAKIIQQERLLEKILNHHICGIEWIPIQYESGIEDTAYFNLITTDFVNLMPTNGIVIPYLQSLMDRRLLRISGDVIYLKHSTLQNSVKPEQGHKESPIIVGFEFDFDNEKKVFTCSRSMENEPLKGASKLFLLKYLDSLGLGLVKVSSVKTPKMNKFNALTCLMVVLEQVLFRYSLSK